MPPLSSPQPYREVIRVLKIHHSKVAQPKMAVRISNLINSRSLLRWRNANKSPVPPLILKLHIPSHQRVKRIVLTLPNINASLMLSPPLPNQNRSRIDQLPAKALNA